jgi:tetratricopeptide (TPR) repeat protein
MNKSEVTRKEIEEKLARVGDYVKLDYLQACLKKQLDFDTRRFILSNLSKIYESRKMYLESGRTLRMAADLNVSPENKVNEFVKSSEMFIKGGNYSEADVSMKKALASGTEKQKFLVKSKVKEIYKMQAQDLLKRDKRKSASEVYEKFLELDLMPEERKQAQQQLLSLYQKLGKLNDYYSLQRNMNAPPIVKKEVSKEDDDSLFKELRLV